MQCQHAHENFSDFVAGHLDRALAVTLENHLDQCASCREEVAGLRRVWSLMDDLPLVDVPPFFHENLMARVNAEIDGREATNAKRRAAWNWRGLFAPRPLAAAAAILIVVLGGLGYVKTQPAALGPFGLLPGSAPRTADSTVIIRQPTLAWATGPQGEQELKVRFQIDNGEARAQSVLKYTIAVGDGTQTSRDLLTRTVPPGGYVDVLVPFDHAAEPAVGTMVITLHAQDGARNLPIWRGTLPVRP